MTLDEIKAMSVAKVAEQLQEYQKWRRGEPPYDYGLVPHPHPFTPYELGAIIDRTVELLNGHKTKTEYLIQRDYGARRKHLWINCTTACDYGSAKAYVEDCACKGKFRILKREVTDWEVVK